MALSRRVDLGVKKLKIFCKVRTMDMNSGTGVRSSLPHLIGAAAHADTYETHPC